MSISRLWPHLGHDAGSLEARTGSLERGIWSGARARVFAGLIVALGLAISAFLAIESRSSAQATNRSSFESTANALSSTVGSKLAVDIGLTRTMRSIATLEPSAGETRLLLWYRQLQEGLPNTRDVHATLIQPVPAADLAAFRRQTETFRPGHTDGLAIFPPGRRPIYCLTRALVGGASAISPQMAQLDYCAPTLPGVGRSPYPALIHAATDTGSFIVTRIPIPGGASLAAIGAAVYRQGALLGTVRARRAAMTGAIGTTFDSRTLISSVLAGRRSLTLTLYHRNIGGPLLLIGSAGANPDGRSPGYTKRIALEEGWVLEASGTADITSSSATAQGVIVLCSGLLVTLLLFLLYRVLTRSRQRAWTMVGEKTGELEYSALHDPLTDLPNRDLVLDRAEQILGRGRRLDVPVTALLVDVDGFKQINDRYGHQVGDEVLRQVAARLQTVLRDNDTVGRLGGDEFVMLLDAVGVTVAPELVAERILDVLRQPIELLDSDRPPVSITVSVGIATGRPASAEDLMQDADLALFKAKAVGKNGYVKFESAMQTAAQDRIRLEVDLLGALDKDQFFLVYQPMLDLESERVVGAEALIRWNHPTGGLISPDAFVPIAEENGMIVAIGRWVLEQACAQAAAWHREGFHLNISVNVSARQLERPEFVEEVRTALKNSGLDPADLTLEITETVLMRKPDVTAQLLGELKGLGLRIAVDDFGTGYSSLAYLRQFPVDSLKIDRTFITGLALSREAHALTHTLIQLGKALGLQTLAEGVEQHSQVRELQREGCDMAQGFLFARPLAPDVLEAFLRDSGGLAESFAADRQASRPAFT